MISKRGVGEKVYTQLWLAGNYQSLEILRCGLQFNFVIIDLTEQETGDKVNKLTDQRSSTDRKLSDFTSTLKGQGDQYLA